jgi:hypothetical protein
LTDASWAEVSGQTRQAAGCEADAKGIPAFAIVRGSEKLPMEDFVALNRRLADALAPKAGERSRTDGQFSFY